MDPGGESLDLGVQRCCGAGAGTWGHIDIETQKHRHVGT